MILKKDMIKIHNKKKKYNYIQLNEQCDDGGWLILFIIINIIVALLLFSVGTHTHTHTHTH